MHIGVPLSPENGGNASVWSTVDLGAVYRQSSMCISHHHRPHGANVSWNGARCQCGECRSRHHGVCRSEASPQCMCTALWLRLCSHPGKTRDPGGPGSELQPRRRDRVACVVERLEAPRLSQREKANPCPASGRRWKFPAEVSLGVLGATGIRTSGLAGRPRRSQREAREEKTAISSGAARA